MSSPREILKALERDYRLALGEYERAEMPTETIVGMKALAAADRRIQAQKRVLKEKMAKIDYLIRRQVDPEWTPHHLTPLHPRRTRRRGTIAKAAYQALRRSQEPMTVREITYAIAEEIGVSPKDSQSISKLDAAVTSSLKARLEDGVVEKLEGRPTRWRVKSRPKWAPSNAPVAFASAPLVRVGDLPPAAIRAAFASSRQVQHPDRD